MSARTSSVETRLFTRADVERVLDPKTCIEAVEQAFRMRGAGARIETAILGLHSDGGGLHVKAATMCGDRSYFAAKLNANFPANRSTNGLPTIQGVLALFDAANGAPLAVMDSIGITLLRTAAAIAVAARHPARKGDITVTIIVGRAARDSDVIITCTTSRTPFLDTPHVSPGTFVAAVGADSEDKSEITPQLMGVAAVVVDNAGQCATIGDLHHAIAAGVMRADDIRAELSDVVCDPTRGRRTDDEIVIFDSTGVALEDVAAAAITYERAVAAGLGRTISFGA